MKVITIRTPLLVNKATSIRAYVYLKHKKSNVSMTLGEYTKKKRCDYISLNEWSVYAIGNSYLSEKTRQDREDVEMAIRREWGDHECYSCPVAVYYLFGVPMPRSWSNKRKQELLWTPVGSRPDEGNYTYAMDNRLEGIAFEDDKLIAHKQAEKLYSVRPFTLIGVCKNQASLCLEMCRQISVRCKEINKEEMECLTCK
jgi:hypothetical protein